MLRTIQRLTMAAALLMTPALMQPARACPNCKEAVAAQPTDQAGVMAGYNWSVLLMIAAPLTLFGSGAWLVGRAAKRGLLPEL